MRLPLCESSTCTPSRPPQRACSSLSARCALAATAGGAAAAASSRRSRWRRVCMCASVLRQHHDLVVLAESVLLRFLRVHVHAVAARFVVGVLHEPVTDGGLALSRGRLEYGVEIHGAAQPDVVGHGADVYLA